jgi:hypothetical protein
VLRRENSKKWLVVESETAFSEHTSGTHVPLVVSKHQIVFRRVVAVFMQTCRQ